MRSIYRLTETGKTIAAFVRDMHSLFEESPIKCTFFTVWKFYKSQMYSSYYSRHARHQFHRLELNCRHAPWPATTQSSATECHSAYIYSVVMVTCSRNTRCVLDDADDGRSIAHIQTMSMSICGKWPCPIRRRRRKINAPKPFVAIMSLVRCAVCAIFYFNFDDLKFNVWISKIQKNNKQTHLHTWHDHMAAHIWICVDLHCSLLRRLHNTNCTRTAAQER